MSDIGSKILSYLPIAEEVAMTIAKVFPPTAGIANAIEMGIKIANGVANEVPAIVQTYSDIKTAAEGGAAVTDDQWTAWEGQIKQAHNDLQAAAAAVV